MSESFEPLLADGVIDAVIGQLKTGKEAEVWLVEHQGEIVAAKIYKERHARNFRNNAGYREGREVRSSRTARAMTKGSRFGLAAAEEAWKSAEVDALYVLHAAGVRVPTPVLFYEGILLMELVIDASGHPGAAAGGGRPHLRRGGRGPVRGSPRPGGAHARRRPRARRSLAPTTSSRPGTGPMIIDFPQTVFAAKNNMAERYFRRDLDNVRNFFARIARAAPDPRRDLGASGTRTSSASSHGEFVPSGRGSHRPPGKRGQRYDGPRTVAAPLPSAPVTVAAPEGPPLDPEEAELRALEAMVLRQGGGERGRPPGADGSRDRRDLGPHRRGGPGRGPRQGPRGPATGGGTRPAGGAVAARGPGGPQRGGPNGGASRGGPTDGLRAGTNDSRRGAPVGAQRAAPSDPRRVGLNDSQRGGPNDARRGGANGAQRGGPSDAQRAGPNGTRRPNDPQRGGPNDPQRGGPNDPRRGGPNDSRRGGPNDSQRGGPNDSRRAGPNDSRRGGPNGAQRGAPNDSQRGAPNDSRRAGPNDSQAHRTQRPAAHRTQRSAAHRTQRSAAHRTQRSAARRTERLSAQRTERSRPRPASPPGSQPRVRLRILSHRLLHFAGPCPRGSRLRARRSAPNATRHGPGGSEAKRSFRGARRLPVDT